MEVVEKKSAEVAKFLAALNVKDLNYGASTGLNHLSTKGAKLDSFSPADGSLIGSVNCATEADYQQVMKTATEAFKEWRNIPAPKRGEIVRQMREALAEKLHPLGQLVSLETGKILAEGIGELQRGGV